MLPTQAVVLFTVNKIMMLNLLQVAGELEGAVEAIPQQEVMKMSLFDMAVKGGWLMLVLLALSIIAIYIFGKKWWMIRKAADIDKNFMKDIHDLIHDGKIRSAVGLCQKYDSPIARLVEKGIERMGRPLQDIQTAVENMGNVEVARLEKGLPMLATVAGGAPMIGFLGTVMGMIQAFFQMAQAGSNIDITMLSGGMSGPGPYALTPQRERGGIPLCCAGWRETRAGCWPLISRRRRWSRPGICWPGKD